MQMHCTEEENSLVMLSTLPTKASGRAAWANTSAHPALSNSSGMMAAKALYSRSILFDRTQLSLGMQVAMAQGKQQNGEDSTDVGSGTSDSESVRSDVNVARLGWACPDGAVLQHPVSPFALTAPAQPPRLQRSFNRSLGSSTRLDDQFHPDTRAISASVTGVPFLRGATVDIQSSSPGGACSCPPQICSEEWPPVPPLPPTHWMTAPKVSRDTPIPTPTRNWQGRLEVDSDCAGNSGTSMALGAFSPPSGVKPVLSYDPRAPAAAMKRRERTAIIADAKKNAVPLKVRPSSLVLGLTSPWNPCQPVKKQPPFPELLRPCNVALLARIDPSMPVSKRVSTFLSTDPPQVVHVRALPR